MTKVTKEEIEKEQDLARNMYLALLALVAAGGFLNLTKSVFIPSFQQEFLGMNLDTRHCIVSVPEEKWARFQEALEDIIHRNWFTLEEIEKLRGTACSFLFAANNLKFFIREMTNIITLTYAKNKGKLHYLFKNTKLLVNEELKLEFQEWQQLTLIQLHRCWTPAVERKVKTFSLFTDSSLAQLGGLLYEGLSRKGYFKMGFTEAMENDSIAQKEAWAILYSLLHFRDLVYKKHLILYVDNQTCCWAFTKESSRSRKLNNTIIKILRVARILECKLEIVWIPTVLQLADKPSREISLNEEFLPQPSFDRLEKVAGFKCHLDAMASDMNFKCNKYLKWRDDNIKFKNCIGIDFLNTPPEKIAHYNIYCFPPKNCMALAAEHLYRHFLTSNFILVLHQFDELPLACVKLLQVPTIRRIDLSSDKAVTFIPSEKRVTLELPDGTHYKFLGTPNIKPRATFALVNDIRTKSRKNRKRKFFKQCRIVSVKNNIK